MTAPGAIEIRSTFPRGLSWSRSGPAMLECRSHALVDDDGGVWLVDPVDGPNLDAELARLGVVVGVIVLLDRHIRDAPAVAARHRARLLVPPGRSRSALPVEAERLAPLVAHCPFRFETVVARQGQWLEQLLWWPEQELLVVAEAVGTASIFTPEPGGALGVHPLLRLRPPRAVARPARRPRLLLLGHGEPVADAAGQLGDAVAGARRGVLPLAARIPSMLLGARRARRSGVRSGC
ncbi:MAG: hypothetical protein JWO69_90 [Thermoleophilia bacterium]|nr:hypothetical protein [Thermoleophilia bacterium]